MRIMVCDVLTGPGGCELMRNDSSSDEKVLYKHSYILQQ